MKLKFTCLYIHLFKSYGLEQFQSYKNQIKIYAHVDFHVLDENVNIRKENSAVTFRQ
jgi:hypothetical protein